MPNTVAPQPASGTNTSLRADVPLDFVAHNGTAPKAREAPQSPSPQSFKTRRRWKSGALWAGALVLLGVITGAWWLVPVAVTVVHPQRRVVVESIAATGQVQGKVESDIGAQSGGRIAQLLVEEGSRIRRGQVLARLDAAVLRAQEEQAADAVRTAQYQLTQVSQPPLPSEIEQTRATTRQAVEVAQARLLAAQQNLTQLIHGPTLEERHQAAGQDRQSQAVLDQTHNAWQRQQRLFQARNVQRGDLDRAVMAFRVAQQADASAQAQLQQAQFDLDHQRELFQTSASANLEYAQTALRVAQRTLEQAQAQAEVARQDAERQRLLFAGGATPRAQLEHAQATFDAANATVEQAKAQEQQARIEQGRQEKLFNNGAVPKAEVQRAETALSMARRNAQQSEAQLTGARQELARQQQLFATNNRAALDDARSAYLAAQGQAQAASAHLRQLTIGTRAETIAQARSDVHAAQSTLLGAERSGRAQLETLLAQPRPEVVAVARARLFEARQALEVARQNLHEAVVVAPFDGVVTDVLTEVGGVTGPNAGIVRLVRLEGIELRIDVDETNLGKLHLGQKAVVTCDAFPNTHFMARVRSIGSQVDIERGTVDVRLIPIAPPRWLRLGLTVSVNVIVDPGTPRLTLPLTAVNTLGSRSHVLVVRGGRAREVAVQTGDAGPDGIPILSGLQSSDSVVISPTGIKDGQRVRIVGG